mmetsp:Transcript_62064/g.173231  ORF Transcript_62064/g.173231 Transcript_62064/m.173231 type:complete len:333 (+) Transcript_62064:802-1800(+)
MHKDVRTAGVRGDEAVLSLLVPGPHHAALLVFKVDQNFARRHDRAIAVSAETFAREVLIPVKVPIRLECHRHALLQSLALLEHLFVHKYVWAVLHVRDNEAKAFRFVPRADFSSGVDEQRERRRLGRRLVYVVHLAKIGPIALLLGIPLSLEGDTEAKFWLETVRQPLRMDENVGTPSIRNDETVSLGRIPRLDRAAHVLADGQAQVRFYLWRERTPRLGFIAIFSPLLVSRHLLVGDTSLDHPGGRLCHARTQKLHVPRTGGHLEAAEALDCLVGALLVCIAGDAAERLSVPILHGQQLHADQLGLIEAKGIVELAQVSLTVVDWDVGYVH